MLSFENVHLRQDEQLDPETCWTILTRVAASSYFRRAPRLRELLLYVGQRSLKDGCDHIPEQEIGVKVFGRLDTYDNANDSIVRTTISDLRKRIDAYFAAEGLHEPIIMEIPRGAYIPVFYSRDLQTSIPETLSLTSPPDPFPGVELKQPKALDRYFRWVSGACIAALSVTCLMLWHQNRDAQKSLHPWKDEPALSSLWSGFLDGNRDTDVVMEDSSVLLVQLMSRESITLSDYINKIYLGAPLIQGADPETSNHLLLVSRKALGKASDFRVALGIKSLDPQNPRTHFYNAREYTPRLLENDNIVLLGNPTSNPWDQWFENTLNFVETPTSVGDSPVINRSPKAGESAVYTSRDKSHAYCVVDFLPKPDHSGDMLLIQGTTSEATEAGGQFLLSNDRLSELQRQMNVGKLSYFEVLLDVSQVLGTALTAKVEAYRIYPNLH